MSARPRAENLENQARAVDDLGLPAPFQVPLLHRGQCAVDDHQTDAVFADQPAEVFKGPAPEEAAWLRAGDPGDLGTHDIEVDGPRKTDRFLQPGFDRTAGELGRLPAERRFQRRMNDERAAGRCAVGRRCGVRTRQDSTVSFPGSNSWIGWPGITVEIACLYTSCECASRLNNTQKLSNQVMIPCSFTPLTRKIVTGVLFFRTWLRNTS